MKTIKKFLSEVKDIVGFMSRGQKIFFASLIIVIIILIIN